jgi:hypothetical protein
MLFRTGYSNSSDNVRLGKKTKVQSLWFEVRMERAMY